MSYESIDVVSLAEKLVAARKAAGLTQEDAAVHLDMSRPTFISIEKAIRRPKPDELVRLAELYKVSLNRLLRDEARPKGALHPHLRYSLDSAGNGSKEVELAIEKLAKFVEDYQFLEQLVQSKPITNFPPAVRIPPGPIERFAEHCAQQERARLNLGSHQPILTLRKVLEEVGVNVFADELESKLAGLYLFVPDFGYCILVNRAHPPERRRWTIAHEYGHFLADRDKPGIDYLKSVSRRVESEKFADVFAGAFLMPEAGVQQRFYEEVDRTGDFTVGDLCRMADFYLVSLHAMTLRLEALGLIPKGSWDEINSTRVRVSEIRKEAGVDQPNDRESLEPYPKRYKLLAVQAFVAAKITEGQLASILRVSRIEAREIVEECLEAPDDADGVQTLVNLSLTKSLLTGTEG
jgi:Zn-dependent peptidase ImmA (M78 family)/transcriptional regulator with XRE-family HTH domain